MPGVDSLVRLGQLEAQSDTNLTTNASSKEILNEGNWTLPVEISPLATTNIEEVMSSNKSGLNLMTPISLISKLEGAGAEGAHKVVRQRRSEDIDDHLMEVEEGVKEFGEETTADPSSGAEGHAIEAAGDLLLHLPASNCTNFPISCCSRTRQLYRWVYTNSEACCNGRPELASNISNEV